MNHVFFDSQLEADRDCVKCILYSLLLQSYCMCTTGISFSNQRVMEWWLKKPLARALVLLVFGVLDKAFRECNLLGLLWKIHPCCCLCFI